MSRDVPYDPEEICDGCGAKGAYDFMGDCLCGNCMDTQQPKTIMRPAMTSPRDKAIGIIKNELINNPNDIDGLAVDIYDALAAATKEPREQLVAWMIEHHFSTGHGDTLDDLLKELSWQIRELRAAQSRGKEKI